MDFGISEMQWDGDDFANKLHDDLFGKRSTWSLTGGRHLSNVNNKGAKRRRKKKKAHQGMKGVPKSTTVKNLEASTSSHVEDRFEDKKTRPESYSTSETGPSLIKKKRKANKRNKYRHLLQAEGVTEHAKTVQQLKPTAAMENILLVQSSSTRNELLMKCGNEAKHEAISEKALKKTSKKLKQQNKEIRDFKETLAMPKLESKHKTSSEDTLAKSEKKYRKECAQFKMPEPNIPALGERGCINRKVDLLVPPCQPSNRNLNSGSKSGSDYFCETLSDATSEHRKTKKRKNSGEDICRLNPAIIRNLLAAETRRINALTPGKEALNICTHSVPTDRSAFIRQQAMGRLNAARFRFLNEQLYNITGREAKELFSQDALAFRLYHEGYQLQVSKWPVNPVDVIIQDLQNRNSSLVIADFGCGEAKISQSFPDRKTYAFDFVAINENVTECDMSKVPLSDDSVDIAVFCLSLMGTNLSDYICEAHRVLHMGGIMKIAEVESRFVDIDTFIANVEKHGFKLLNKDSSFKYFLLMDFEKCEKSAKKAKLPVLRLEPCLYKKR